MAKAGAMKALLGVMLLASASSAPLRADHGGRLEGAVINVATPALGNALEPSAPARKLLHAVPELIDDVSNAGRHLMQDRGNMFQLNGTNDCLSFGAWYDANNRALGGKVYMSPCEQPPPPWLRFYQEGDASIRGNEYNQCLMLETKGRTFLEHRPCNTPQTGRNNLWWLIDVLPDRRYFRIKYEQDPDYCVCVPQSTRNQNRDEPRPQVAIMSCGITEFMGCKDTWMYQLP